MRKSGWISYSGVVVDGESGWRCWDVGPGRTRLSREAGILSRRRLGMLLILFRRRGWVSRCRLGGKVDSVGVWGVIVEWEDVVSKELGRVFLFPSVGVLLVAVAVVVLLVVG